MNNGKVRIYELSKELDLDNKDIKEICEQLNIAVALVTIVVLLAVFWRPLGLEQSILWNLVFVGIICFGLLGAFTIFRKYYTRLYFICIYQS